MKGRITNPFRLFLISVGILLFVYYLYSSKELVTVWISAKQSSLAADLNTKSVTTSAESRNKNDLLPITDYPASRTPLPDSHCQPRRNVYFMKTHKTGSTTMQNILLRYAWANDLIVGLPVSGNNFAGYAKKKKFDKSMMQPVTPNRSVNMIMHHMIFDYAEVSKILPSDTLYFTFLRDPATQFESVFKYFKTVVAPFAKVKSMEDFLASPEKYFNGVSGMVYSWFAKNGMTFDLGFDNLKEDDGSIKAIIKKIDEIFDLILISEYFDASLILLREKMCWSLKDILYLSVNARRPSTVQHLNKEADKKIREWNKIDSSLYDYYNKTFWQRVATYGVKKLQYDLEELSRLKVELKNYCVEERLLSNSDVKDAKYKMYNPPGVDMTQYRLKESAKNNETCIQLILPEIPWWKKMSQRQKSLLRK